MLTTAAELTTLCQVFLSEGQLKETRVLSKASVAAMTRDQTSAMASLPEPERLRQRWGLGWRLRDGDLNSRNTFGHGGATGTEAHGNSQSLQTGLQAQPCLPNQPP